MLNSLLEQRWAKMLLALVLLALFAAGIVFDVWRRSPETPVPTPIVAVRTTSTPTAALPTPTPPPPPVVTEAAPVGVTSSLTVPENGSLLTLVAQPQRVGWVSRDANGVTDKSFPDFFIYAGTDETRTYQGVVGFVPPPLDDYGPTVDAELVLSGLLGDAPPPAEGQWTVELLADDGNFWGAPNYDSLTTTPAFATLATFEAAELQEGAVLRIPLAPTVVEYINAMRYHRRGLTLRLRGPETAEERFSFDGRVGATGRGIPPQLFLAARALEPTVTPVVVIPSATPKTVETAAALVLAATAQAQTATATPTPYNLVVATPLPANSQPITYWVDESGNEVPVVVPTPLPANEATAQADAARATAVALTTGTPTPLPDRYVTATPTPTPVTVMATLTPESVVTQAALLVQATALAQRQGTATPLPAGAVIITPTPRLVVVTATPTPKNQATAQALAAAATVQAITTGTATPYPRNLVFASPTPTETPLPLIMVAEALSPTPVPAATPATLPDVLRGKILFLSDRGGKTQLYALDPVSGQVYVVTQSWPRDVGQGRLGLAPDGKRRAIVAPGANSALQIKVHYADVDATRDVTALNGISYDPAWSPVGDRIAFVSTDSGNDEIYTVNPDGSDLRRLTNNTWEWDKHPSWSPDGSQIVFWSNRESGRAQLWVMNADGSNPRNLSNNSYSDWDPIWVP